MAARREAKPRGRALGCGVLEEIDRELHALSQPLTALQWRLEVGKRRGDCKSLEAAVEDSLAETRRTFAAVARVRVHVQRAQRACAEGGAREPAGVAAAGTGGAQEGGCEE